MPERFRKKPVEITAIRWTGDNIIEVMAFMAPQEPVYVNNLSHVKFTNADDLVRPTPMIRTPRPASRPGRSPYNPIKRSNPLSHVPVRRRA
jgi:hypothetical protein